MAAGPDEHIIKCSYCGRDLIVEDNINNGVAFLSHLKNDHDIFYTPQRMIETKTRKTGHQQTDFSVAGIVREL